MTLQRRILLAIVAILGIGVLLFITHIGVEHHKFKRRLVHLLCETNHQALLDACREVSRRAAAGEFQRGKAYAVRRRPGQYNLPQAIMDVDPLFIQIDHDGLVQVALGWLPAQGVVAHPEGYRSYTKNPESNRELVPGLWFYDEDYNSDHPKWVAYIDELIAKGRKMHLGASQGQAPSQAD